MPVKKTVKIGHIGEDMEKNSRFDFWPTLFCI